jgi:hypothetical protein
VSTEIMARIHKTFTSVFVRASRSAPSCVVSMSPAGLRSSTSSSSLALEQEFGVRFGRRRRHGHDQHPDRDGAHPSARQVSASLDQHLELAVLIRAGRRALLRLFAEGKVAGTTHTCIGQELSAVMLADSLDRERDIIFSNHRCHGHFIAWTGDVEGLIAEVMGRRTGVCRGIGGSQHLCGRQFFSNGVQGGIVPVSAGIAYAQKLSQSGGIVAVCVGDGTLGEGVRVRDLQHRIQVGTAAADHARETICMHSRPRSARPSLVTSVREQRPSAFARLLAALGSMRRSVQPCAPRRTTTARPARRRSCAWILIRLAAHSKGDDDRDSGEIRHYASAIRSTVSSRHSAASTSAYAQPMSASSGQLRAPAARPRIQSPPH